MVQSNQAKRSRKKTGHLLEWVKAIAPCLIIAMIGLGVLSYFFEREKEAALRFLNIVKLLAEDSKVVRAGAVTAMGDFYRKYHDQASQVLAYHLYEEEEALVRRAILNVLEQAGAEAIEPLVWMNRLLAEKNDWTVDSMKKSLKKDSLHDFSEDSFTENLSDIVTALATVLRKGDYPKDQELDLSTVILVNQSSQGFIKLDLSQANLKKANLREACLIRVSLEKADLREAKLVDILFHDVDLRGAFLQGATLSPVRSGWVILVRANLTDANLTDAFLQGADMEGAILVRAELPRADLSGANLTDANLQRAFLESATMEDTILNRANLAGANLTDTTLTDAVLKGADMKEAILVDAWLPRADLSGANLTDANLQRAFLKNATMEDTILKRANLGGANLTNARLVGADMKEANLVDARLPRADLSGANLTDATLTDAFLQGAKMEGATLKGADLRGANLIGATFDPRDIKEAKNWEKAIYDDAAKKKLGLTKINQ